MVEKQDIRKIPSRAILVVAIALAMAASGTVAVWYINSQNQSGQSAAPVTIDPQDAALVALGRTVYADNCAGCHGVDLEGAPNWRTRNDDGILPAPPHDETGHTWHHPDAVLMDITRLGGQKFMPQGFQSGMPAFGETLSEREIAASLAFIFSSWPKKVSARQNNITRQSQ